MRVCFALAFRTSPRLNSSWTRLQLLKFLRVLMVEAEAPSFHSVVFNKTVNVQM